ncbi:regulatory protein RecX [Paenibacillus sp. NEAU-GSW1]|uniref:regulatory protein RecX n=1 Tax=Paenibacillus sp. NEAU-GSW1 TaxID=2682486 RepID=UPI0012E263A2|nr:RecX family transcriptional regulator [Paenibacillus sp. NEAU-GSW1]
MLEIKAVKQDRKERSRFHIYGEDEEAVLTVHEDLLIKYRLLKGRTLTDSELEQIREEDNRYRTYALAVAYLGARPRTRKQLEQYLQRKAFEEEHISAALERLENEHFVDDDEYARQFALQRIKYAHKGRRWIKQELQLRGVSKQAAASAAEAIDKGAELEAAIIAAGKKWRSLKGEERDRRMKLMAFLMRRGFPGDIVKEAVRSVLERAAAEAADDDDGLMLDN